MFKSWFGLKWLARECWKFKVELDEAADNGEVDNEEGVDEFEDDDDEDDAANSASLLLLLLVLFTFWPNKRGAAAAAAAKYCW